MPEADPSRADSWRGQAAQLAGEVVQMISLRRELAELEARHDLHSLRRLAIVGGIGILLTLIGLPVLVVCAAHGLDQWIGLGFVPTALILAAVLVIPGVALVGHAVKRFGRDFRGMRNSLAELREDLIWLREWTESSSG